MAMYVLKPLGAQQIHDLEHRSIYEFSIRAGEPGIFGSCEPIAALSLFVALEPYPACAGTRFRSDEYIRQIETRARAPRPVRLYRRAGPVSLGD